MILRALLSLRPGAHWTMDGEGYAGINWHDVEQTKPTEQEVLEEIDRIRTLDAGVQYKQQRAKQYPSIADQLDMLWHAIDTGTLDKNSDFYSSLKAVKDANPKP